MDADLAQNVVQQTREQAVAAARADLRRQSKAAVEAGREESRRLIKTSFIDRTTGDIRYNPAGRLLRDWYLHVYLNTLRGRLGLPAEPIDAQQIEDITAQAHRLIPQAEGIHSLRAVAVTRLTAEDDASHATLVIVTHLRDIGAARAITDVPDDRFDADLVRVHVTRHWYLRCYLDHIEAATDSRAPLAEITAGEEHVVAETLQTRVIRRVIGRDGVPLVTRHGMQLNDIDRGLAAGTIGTMPGNLVIDETHTGFKRLQDLVVHSWATRDKTGRRAWSQQAGMHEPDTREWQDLSGDQQSALIRRYLDVNRTDVVGEIFDRPGLRGEPSDAARRMFNHSETLAASETPRVTPASSALDVRASALEASTNRKLTAR